MATLARIQREHQNPPCTGIYICSWVSRGRGQRKLLPWVMPFRSQQCHFGFLNDSETIYSEEIPAFKISLRILILRAFSSIMYQPHPRIRQGALVMSLFEFSAPKMRPAKSMGLLWSSVLSLVSGLSPSHL